MWRALWQRGIISLSLVIGVSAALRLSPPERTTPLYLLVRDSVCPAAAGVSCLEGIADQSKHFLQSQLQRWGQADSHADSRPSAKEVERLSRTQRSMEARLAWYEQELQRARSQIDLLIPVQDRDPLLQPTAVRARILGSSRRPTGTLQDRLLNAGRSSGVALDDLVLQSPPEGLVDFLQIDAGKDSGISIDAPVCCGCRLVGRIQSCGRLMSTVQLSSDPGFRIGAQVVRSTPDGPVIGTEGVFVGGGEAPGRLEFVPPTAPVAIGDRIYTHATIAGGAVMLFIGTVSRAELGEGDPHWQIEVSTDPATTAETVDVLTWRLHAPQTADHPPMDAPAPSAAPAATESPGDDS